MFYFKIFFTILIVTFMKICLKTYAQQGTVEPIKIVLQERLPPRIQAPVELIGSFQVENYNDYYLLSIDAAGILAIECQRCLKTFNDDYSNQTKLAVCRSDAVAEGLMAHFECIVLREDELNLSEILTDELYLFSPEKHWDFADCDSEVRQWICDKSEIIETTLGLSTKTR